jgi:hypothetical protein
MGIATNKMTLMRLDGAAVRVSLTAYTYACMWRLQSRKAYHAPLVCHVMSGIHALCISVCIPETMSCLPSRCWELKVYQA